MTDTSTAEKTQIPDVTAAEPIPASAMSEVNRLLGNGDLYRYTTAESPVTQLEREFAAKMGSRYALAVSSCSAALFISLKALGLPPGAKVLIPAFTFVAVPSAVVHAECVPVLCECGSNYRIDLDEFHRKLPDVDAVLVSHMRGHTSDMDAIMAACDAAGNPCDRRCCPFARNNMGRAQNWNDWQDRMFFLPILQAFEFR